MKLVKEKRRSTRRSVKRAASQDSKGESPQRQQGRVEETLVEARGQATAGGVTRFVKYDSEDEEEVECELM